MQRSLAALALLIGLAGPRSPAPLAPPSIHSCAPLPPPSGTLVNVSTVPQLQNAVANLASNTTILIADGDYPLTQMLRFRSGVSNVALRGLSGNRGAVVLRGPGMSNPNFGNVPHVISIEEADDVLIADLTLRDAYYHLVQVHGEDGPQRPRFHNLHLIDAGEQFIKGSTNGAQQPRRYTDGGVVACSLFEYTDRARSWYTNAVDVLAGADWVIRDNVFRRIRAPLGQLAGPAVLMWRNSLNTVVERNHFIECDRAIALGLSAPDINSRAGEAVFDHQGGVVRNNFIYRAGSGDVGITVNYALNFKILHNTVLLNGTFPWGAIEYRFAASSGTIRYNLTDAPIWQRDGATAALAGNVTNAQPGWFANAAAGDLHLLPSASAAIDQAAALADAPDDYDAQARPIGPAPDVGADEYGAPPPAAVSDLRATNAVEAGGVLTTTLRWSPPSDAVTITLRYSSTLITESNWIGAAPLTDALPGGAGVFTASVPYAGGTLYFGLRSQNAAGGSPLSNNAFWPAWFIDLPLVRR